ncbi:MAG: ribonuclease P [Methanosarcinaceae archaeon]|nr:ribonuclease P [Methanosarcinaceae archaeon]
MSRPRKRQKHAIKDIAAERMVVLFGLAQSTYATHPDRSDRYVDLARRVGMRYRVRMPSALRRRICRKCHSFLVPGSSARVRLHGRYLTITCSKCGNHMRYPYHRDS